MTKEEARIALLKAFVATRELDPEIEKLLSQIIKVSGRKGKSRSNK